MMGDKSQSLVFGKAHYDPYHYLFIWMVKWQFPGRLGQAIYCMLGESGWRLRRGREGVRLKNHKLEEGSTFHLFGLKNV
jgi:hypothetical protein